MDAATSSGARSAPASPTTRSTKSPLTSSLRARHPSSGARTPNGSFATSRVPPPRRMSTRLQLTLRERLHSRRGNDDAEPTHSEAAEEDDDDDDDDENDDDDPRDGSSSDSSSDDDAASPDSPTGATSSSQPGAPSSGHPPRRGSGHARSKAGTSVVKRERRRRRRRRRWFRQALDALVVVYYLLSVPLRFGLYFDPFFTAPYANQWTHALTVFITLDAIADVTNVVVHLWKRRVEQRRLKRQFRSLEDLRVDGVEAVEVEEPSPPRAWRQRRSEVLDVVAFFPIEIVLLATGQYNALHIARLTKLLALRSVPRALGDYILTTQTRPVVAPSIQGRVLGRFLATLMVIGVVWVHWSALIYVLIAHVECGLDLTRSKDCASWAVDDQLRGVEAGGGGGSRFRAYSRAVYWASRTVITLGFSDVVANASRSTESFYMILGEFAGAFWCACVIAGFAYWFTLQHRRGSKYSHEMFVHRVEHLLGRPHFGHSNADNTLGSVVPDFLRRQIVEYLHHEWEKSRVFGESQFRSIVRQEQLRQGLTCELKTTKLLRLPCFSRQSLGFLNALAAEMKLVSLAPLDWIIEYPGTQSVFFVVISGVVAVVSPDENGEKIYTCNPGDCFGAITLYDPSLKEKAFAEDYTEVLMLDSDGLELVLKTYYHDRQSTASQQRAEMHKAAQDDYTTFIERCRRRRDRRSVLERQGESAAAHSIPHWDKMQTELECAPREWTHPLSQFRVYWEALRCLALLYLTFEVPYNVIFYYGGTKSSSFGAEGGWRFRTTFILSVLVEVFFCVDLYIRCYAFLPRKNMKTRTFYLDAVANVPLALIVDVYDGCTIGPLPGGWKWLSLFRLIRLLRVRRLKTRIVATLPRANGVAQFITYCAVSILVYCHAVACVWFLAGHYGLPLSTFVLPSSLPSKPDCLRMAQEHSNCTWTVMDGMEAFYDSDDHRFVYLRSLYFSVSTFTTVAYGDILPYSTLETWIAAIATYIGGVLCYVMFGAMGAALARLARRRRENRYENHLRARVLEMHGVSRRVRSEINRFQAFRSNVLAEFELEQEVLQFVTAGLRSELNKCIHAAQAKRFAFLQRAKPAFCDAVASCMVRRYYFSGDTIFSAGELAKEAMVIRRGRVQLADGSSHAVVASLKAGATLGERSFLTQVDTILVDYIAETLVEVSVFSREALVELWKHYPSEMQRMVSDEGDESDYPSRKYEPMSSASVNDATHALSRMLVRQESRLASGGLEFEKRVKWQRAVNGSTFRSRWELLVGSVVVYNTFSIIARVAFIPAPSTSAMAALTCIDYVFDIVLLVDIYLKSTHFLPPGDLLSVSTRIYDAKYIRSFYYQEGWMVFDVIASVPLYYVGSNYALMTYFRLPRIIRAFQLVEIGERIHAGLLHRWTSSTSSAGVAYSLVGLSKVLVVMLLCCHVGGSVFYAASVHESETSGRAPWVRGDVVMGQHVGDLGVAYLRSFYWAISTVTVVNYGDIVATTVRETLWACVICLSGTFFMSKVISDLVDLLQSLDQCAMEHRERVEQFEYVAQRRELPDELTERGQMFLNYEYEVSHGLPPPEELFSSLPSQLQAQVYNEMYGSILRRVPLFETLSDSQVRELAAAPWRTEVYLPSDVIVFENSLADSLYVMKQGRAEILRYGSQLSISQIDSGELFGEAMFFVSDEDHKRGRGGPRRMASVRALSFCEVLRLDREAWLRFMGMRASNRAAGQRVLEIAQGEQLKSRTLLQKLESNLDQGLKENDEEHFSSRSSNSSNEKEDIVKSPKVGTNVRSVAERNLRTASAPPGSVGPTNATASVRRIGSTPAALFSHIVRSLSSNQSARRESDAYSALSTPTTARRIESPTRESPSRNAKPGGNAMRRFESSPLTPEHGLERGNERRELEEPKSTPQPRFVDTSVFCYRWDAVKFFTILYYVAALPLRVSFYDDIERAAQESSGNGERVMTIWIICEYVLIDGFLWLDILMRLFVFIPTVRGEPLTSTSERRRWYVRHGSFLVDVLGSFPLEILSLLPINEFHSNSDRGAIVAAGFRLTTLVRCFQLEPLWWRLERQLFWFQKDTLTILKIVFIGVLSSHWIACLWYFVGNASMDSNTLSWLTAPNMLAFDPTGTGSPLTSADVDNVSMLNKYLRSYHFAIGSISTTTFGDIVSRNVAETFAQLVVTFLCLVFYGYVTSGVRQILSRKFSRTIALEHDDAKIRRFARRYKLSRSLTALIRSHLRERWRQESDVDQKAIAHLVHAPLRRSIAAYLRSSLFETVEPRRLAFDSLPEMVVLTILAELREEAYVAGEVIYEQYAVGRVMYFVESGTVELSTTHRGHVGTTTTSLKHQGEFFGESCVVDRDTCGSERSATAVAHTESRLAVLDLDAYERVLALFPTHAPAIRAAWSSLSGSFAV